MTEEKKSRVQKLAEFERLMRWRTVEPREKVDRDRTLTGKARVKARKAKQRAARAEQ